MKQEEVKQLLERVKHSSATDEDCDRLMALLSGDQSAEFIIYATRYYEEQHLSFEQPDDSIWKNIFEKIVGVDKKVLSNKPETPVHSISFFRRYWAVASVTVLLLLAAGAYFWTGNKGNKAQTLVKANAQEIKPGHEGAILTLADGSKVLLDTIHSGTVALQSGVTAKVKNGALVYEGTGSEVVYNAVQTPKGRQYHLTLPDGSEVWLNSLSSIRYPTSFRGKERRVEITGEAYFEVAEKKGLPFHVKINDMTSVEVMGTHFNINSYSNERSINTTLIEGSVKVTGNISHALLKPGQQARVKDRIDIYVDVDIDQVMAWKNGLFDFEGLSITEIMRQLERWYDIEVEFENGVKDNIRFTGGISKGVTLNQLLEALEVLDIHFQLDGRRLIIKP
ncbi:FecR domain-containing protein [Agriterribacter sp.]|uniref:FecR family protein n=1 Tax=Agriterribacter sp. TaxID=2821509 RepID=UPI002B525287|nr:FecR domain-containing protein [Agriterribacter sp.]HRO45906.1 DUF4974 domain-containing protein [Agriterribacter sp.]HRO97267.1 DUF4974 domain-containing protein [Ferruginibacter sp.]